MVGEARAAADHRAPVGVAFVKTFPNLNLFILHVETLPKLELCGIVTTLFGYFLVKLYKSLTGISLTYECFLFSTEWTRCF
jgi:hypothetical protein